MKTKHTEGRLKVITVEEWPFDIITLDSNNNEVFRRRLPAYSSKDGSFDDALNGVHFIVNEVRKEVKAMNHRALADEKIRAAAPVLLEEHDLNIKRLEALKSMLGTVDRNSLKKYIDGMIQSSDTVIKKATE
jgi:ferritin-like metal-binding protein YciE